MSGDQHNHADPLNLDAIEARANAATAGPWQEIDDGYQTFMVVDLLRGDDLTGSGVPIGDAEFIAHAREDVPALVAEVRRLREQKAAVDLLDWPGEAHRLQAALHFARGTIADLSATVERLEDEASG